VSPSASAAASRLNDRPGAAVNQHPDELWVRVINVQMLDPGVLVALFDGISARVHFKVVQSRGNKKLVTQTDLFCWV